MHLVPDGENRRFIAGNITVICFFMFLSRFSDFVPYAFDNLWESSVVREFNGTYETIFSETAEKSIAATLEKACGTDFCVRVTAQKDQMGNIVGITAVSISPYTSQAVEIIKTELGIDCVNEASEVDS